MPEPPLSILRSLGVLLHITAMASPAYGSERLLTAHLDWKAPTASDCPSANTMMRAVETRLSRTVFVEGKGADVWLSVAIEPKGGQWSARLELLDAARSTLGTRTLQSKSQDCSALNDTLPVVVALLVDASRLHVDMALPQPSYQPPKPQTGTSPFDTREATAQSRAHDPNEAPFSVGWAVSGEVVSGLLPGLSPGASASGFVEQSRLRVPMELWLGALTSSSDQAALRVSLFHVGTGLCPRLWRGSLHWALCAGVEAGSLQAFGRGFNVNLSATSIHLAVRTSTQLDIPIVRPWFTRIEAGAILPLIRRRFVGESEPQVRSLLHRPAAIAPFLAVGVGVGFR